MVLGEGWSRCFPLQRCTCVLFSKYLISDLFFQFLGPSLALLGTLWVSQLSLCGWQLNLGDIADQGDTQ